MQTAGMRISLYVLLAGTTLAAGCGSQTAARPVEPNVSPPTRMLCEAHVAPAAALQAAQEVLSRMHFSIEKFDVEHGVIRTRPLRGAQFFEFWRGDNAGGFNAVEANVETIRRTVELRVGTAGREPGTENAPASALSPSVSNSVCLECYVSVQRLTLPENEVPSISQMYRMHSQSTPTTQRLIVTPAQQRAMTWIALGPDARLEAEILKRIERRLSRLD